MRILAIETSCDETGVAILDATDKRHRLLSNSLASSLSLHAKTGGIIPEVAAREQIRSMIPVLQEAINKAAQKDISDYRTFIESDIDAIAVTVGPGLIGSLLVGIETAKTIAFTCNKPLIPVNHLFGHIYANWLDQNLESRIQNSELEQEKDKLNARRYNLNAEIKFPAIALVVSGGHTDLVMMKSHTDIEVIGGTRDDAAGEAFDKIGRLLGFPYPAGPMIAKLAEHGNSKAYTFPRPMIGSDDFDFSFSGLKTAALRETKIVKQWDKETIANFCASVQQAIVDVLVKKTLKAAKEYKAESVLLGGGVAANQKLQDSLAQAIKNQLPETMLFIPQKEFCTDNAAMIAAAAMFQKKTASWEKVTARPDLYY